MKRRFSLPAPAACLAAVIVLCTVALAPAAMATGPIATTDGVPRFDIETTCRNQARYAFAATLGQADPDKEFALCTERERAMLTRVQAIWLHASVTARRDCVPLADAKSGAKYSTLARCLDGSR